MNIAVFLAGISGLIYGSFLNVLLWRLPEGQGIGGRSHCRSCHHILAWYDLVPILSFIALRSRCRYCQARIHIRYPIVETVAAITLGIFFAVQQPGLNLESAITIFILLILVSLLFFDLFYLVLPDVFVLPAIGVFLIYDITRIASPLSYFSTALLSAAIFAILYAVSRGKKMGLGDVKLAFLIGLVLGYPFGFLAIVGGVWLATIAAFFLLIFKKATLQDAIPLGSALATSTILFIIFHYEILPLTIFFR